MCHGQALRDGWVRGEQVTERAALVGSLERATLDDRICLLPRQATLLDQRHEDAGRRVKAEPALDVLAHPLRPDHEALHERGHLRQHVVEEDRGVGEDDSLGAAVADVALVPERLVLERRARIAPEEPGESASRSLTIGLRLWGIAELPF